MSAFGFASPNRVLDNIKRLESQEAELPSLPSIQPNIDYDFELDTSDGSFDADQWIPKGDSTQDDLTTPHPRISHASTSSTSMSTSSSPYPPIAASNGTTPHAPSRALTSTPFSLSSRTRRITSENDTRSTMRQFGHSRHRSADTGEFGSGNTTGRERWHTPGEMSGSSFEGDEIVEHASGSLGTEQSIPLRDVSNSFEQSTDSPTTKRLSKSHVLLQRPGRRSGVMSQSYIAEEETAHIRVATPIQEESPSTSSPQTALRIPEQDRVPSLTRSEASTAPDTSEAASTPEGPSRRSMIHSTMGQLSYQHEDRSQDDVPTFVYPAMNGQMSTSSASSSAVSYQETPAPVRRISPLRKAVVQTDPAATPLSQMSTPGQGREPAAYPDYVDSRFGSQTPHTALRDVTASNNNLDPSFTPFTPSPIGMLSKNSDFSTPRAPLDDAERRKNHVLAVLSSSKLPARPKVKGTPHPLRRFSTSPISSDTPQSATPASQSFATPRRDIDIPDRSSSAPPNESFVSVASSADLTTDRRATTQPNRANTSFPTILLNQNNTREFGGSDGTPSSFRTLGGDRRADGIKINKHLNSMNKQLLESNGELAREAEAWQGEVKRLMELLVTNDIEVEEVDVLANVRNENNLDQSRSFNSHSQDDMSARSTNVSTAAKDHEHMEMMQEMTEKLDNMEEILNGKDQEIVELQDQVQELENGNRDARMQDLQDSLNQSEEARSNLHAEFAAKTEQHAKKFGEICLAFEEQVKGLESELANSRAETAGLREGGSLARDDGHDAAKDEIIQLREIVEERDQQIEEITQSYEAMETEMREVLKQLEDIQSANADLEDQLRNVLVENEALQAGSELRSETAEIRGLLDRLAELEDELNNRSEKAETDGPVLEQLRNEIEDLNEIITEKDGHIESLQNKVDIAELAAGPLRQSLISPRQQGQPSDVSGDQASFVVALEERLDEAYREIGRLKHELAATPHRKQSGELKDQRIKSLEREKQALQGRLSSVKRSFETPSPNGSLLPAGSPFGKKPTPFIHRAIASLRTPLTPGPMKELSWLQTTIGDTNEPILRAQVEYLQNELNHANSQLDQNFSRLEAAGMGGVELAEKLSKAQSRIAELEDEIMMLLQKNKAALVGLSTRKNQLCRENEERLKQSLEEIRLQMTNLQSESNAERKRLQSEIGRLKEAKSSVEMSFEKEIAQMKDEIDGAIATADEAIAAAKQDVYTAQKESAVCRKDLETARRKVMDLERAVSDKAYEIDQLRHQQARRPSDSDVNQRIKEIQNLQRGLRSAQQSLEDVGQNLRVKAEELDLANVRISDMMAERATVRQELDEFERDLHAQRVKASRLVNDMEIIQRQRSVAEGDKIQLEKCKEALKTLSSDIKANEREVGKLRSERDELIIWKADHDCEAGTHEMLDDQKSRFKAQTRDLAAQIRYLKAKFTREATFRNGLALQKKYLLLLIGGMSLNEQATLKALATMGYPQPSYPPPRPSFKSVGLVVLGLIRARNSAARWRSEKDLKANVVANLEERRRVSGNS